MKAVLPKNEAVRLEVLHDYKVLDTEPEAELDALTRLAAYICGTPIALISLVDAKRQWFKSKVGLTVAETPREFAFCAHTILQNDCLNVPDALADQRFATNPLVISDPNIRFYAGAPLISPQGLAMGSLCVIDYVPRKLEPEQLEALQALSRQIITLLELRRKLLANCIRVDLPLPKKTGFRAKLNTTSCHPSLVGLTRTHANIKRDMSDRADSEILMENISDRKQTQQELHWQEALLRSMTSASSIAFYVVDNRTDNILYFNHQFCEIWGIEHLEESMQRGELKNQDIIACCLPLILDVPAFAEIYEPLQSEENRCIVENEIALVDARIMRLFSNQVRDKQDRYLGRLYLFEDITARKQAAQKILEQAALLDIATDAILVRDLNNQILFWNKGAERLYGWQAQEVIGANANQLLFKDTLIAKEAFESVILVGEWSGELEKVTKFDKQIIVESRWTLMRDLEGQPKSILCVDTDITEKKQLLAQLLRTQRLESIGTLASGIVHDLNNVLAPILMSTQLLGLRISDERSQQLLEVLESNAKRGSALLKQVLSFARGVEGKHATLQLRHLIEEIVQVAQETFPKSIAVYTNVEPDLWAVFGDVTQLHQVLMNLCVNARDAMPSGGTLKIFASNFFIDENYARMHLEAKVGPYVVLTVADKGSGIAPEILERIFEPFFTTKELGKGTGLGLSTVRGIVKSHGGFIDVYTQIGRGTQFKVYFPATEVTEQARSQEVEIPSGQGELILVVDDEAAICEITKTSLESYNYKVITASDGIDAIAVYVQRRTQISLVVLDLMIPAMDGFNTIRTLQKLNPNVKIIAVSGLASTAQVAAATASGVKAFLSKPYTTQELLTTIHELLM